MSYDSKHKGVEVEGLLNLIPNKVDKVEGKQLSTEDFTTLLKQKLEGLSNYDDSEIVAAFNQLRTEFNALVGGNASAAINSFNEIIAFLEGIEDSQKLDSIIASIEQQIAAKPSHSDIPTTAAILQAVYPIGSIYMSMTETNPSVLFGFGTWEQVKGRFLVGAANTLKAGDIGGEATVTLTQKQVPAHTHTRGTMEIYGALTERPCSSSAEILNSKTGGAFTSIMKGDDLQWGVTVQTSGSSTHKNNLHEFRASRNWTGETSSVGGGEAHNNLPPYLVVYIWKRTA